MKLFFVLTLFFAALRTEAQSLTLDQLLLLSGKSQEAVDIYLGARGWEQAPASDAGDYAWAYGRRKSLSDDDLLNPKYIAFAWFHMLTLYGLPSITYSVPSNETYQGLKQRAVTLGFKRITYAENAQGSDSYYSNGKYKFYVHMTFNSNRLLSKGNSYEVAISKVK